MGSGAASSAGRSRVRGRSRGVGGPPDAGGWSWSLVTRPVLCRFARDGMVVGMSSVIVIVSLVRCDPCRHPALSGFPCNPDGARAVPEMLPRPGTARPLSRPHGEEPRATGTLAQAPRMRGVSKHEGQPTVLIDKPEISGRPSFETGATRPPQDEADRVPLPPAPA